MQARMARTLSVVLLLAWASVPAAAQLNPPATQLPQSSPDRALPSVRPSGNTKDERKIQVRLFSFARDAQADFQQRLKSLQLLQADGAIDPPPSCAHLLIYAAPRTLDTGMIIEVPKDYESPMPAWKALPPCSRDFRPRFFIVQTPPPRFMKPARIDTPPADSEKHRGLLQPQ